MKSLHFYGGENQTLSQLLHAGIKRKPCRISIYTSGNKVLFSEN